MRRGRESPWQLADNEQFAPNVVLVTQIAPTPTWTHPLFGADFFTLLRILTRHGALPPRVWPLVAAGLAASLGRAPFSLVETVWAKKRLRRLGAIPPPVFILGHWRSGTTHLFNLLSRDPAFAWVDPIASGLPWDFLLLGRWLRPLLHRALPADRYIDRVKVTPDMPQEDEIGLAAMQTLSYYHGLYFPRHFATEYRRGVFLDEVAQKTVRRWEQRCRFYNEKLLLAKMGDGGDEWAPAGRTLLIKNPVYTARVAQLRTIWPDARFIHIVRNPYVVYRSTRRFYQALLPKLALQPYAPDVAEQAILEGYPRMMAQLAADTADLPPNRFVTLRFEDLEASPLAQLAHLYQQLELPGFAAARPRFAAYLETVRDYRKGRHDFPPECVAKVDRHWQAEVRALGYTVPQ